MYRDLAGHELIMIGPDNCIDPPFFFFFFFFRVLVYCARCFVPKFDTLWNDTQSLLICICRGERGPRRRISPSETSGVQTQGALACSKRGGYLSMEVHTNLAPDQSGLHSKAH